MAKYILKRLLMLIPVLLGISFVVLILIDITPGDPARILLGAQASEEQVEELREEMGLNESIPVRYIKFVWSAVQGDFGNSYVSNLSVFDEIMMRFPYTLFLVTLSLALAILLGIPLGIYAATHQFTWKDNAAMFIALFCVSMPNFWFALILARQFAVELRWFPLSGVENWKSWILPCVSLALGLMAVIARQMRSDMLEVIRQDYITTARAKGLPENKVIYRHGLKNAMIPVLMVIGGVFGVSLGGSLIAEVIFSLPGLGQYTLTGLGNRDYPVIQGSVLFISTMFALVILLVDVIFAFIDPRIRSQYIRKRKRRRKVENNSEA